MFSFFLTICISLVYAVSICSAEVTTSQLTQHLNSNDLDANSVITEIKPREVPLPTVKIENWLLDWQYRLSLNKQLSEMADATLQEIIPVENHLKSLLVLKDYFPDNEVYMAIPHFEQIKGRDFSYRLNLSNPRSFMELLFLCNILKRHGANSISLIIQQDQYEKETNLRGVTTFFSMIHSLTDGIPTNIILHNKMQRKLKKVTYTKFTSEKVSSPKKSKQPPLILYLDNAYAKEASHLATSLRLKAINITQLDLKNPTPLLIYHKLSSFQNYDPVVEMITSLPYLKERGFDNIDLYLPYIGYARQDKVFEDTQGAAISIQAIINYLKRYTDNIYALTVHNATTTGPFQIGQHEITNINTLPFLAMGLVDKIIEGVIQDQPKGRHAELIQKEFEEHPLLLAAPDRGASIMVLEAAELVEKYLQDQYGVTIPIEVVFLSKKRYDSHTVKIEKKLFRYKDRKNYRDLVMDKEDTSQFEEIDLEATFQKNGESTYRPWVILLDDETSTRGTIKAATYALVEKLGFNWQRVLTAVDKGKYEKHLDVREGGYPLNMIYDTTVPKTEPNHEKEHLGPKTLASSRSYPSPHLQDSNVIEIAPYIAPILAEFLSSQKRSEASLSAFKSA